MATSSTTRKGNGAGRGGPANGAGLWGPANGMGWGGESQGSGLPPRRMKPEERAALRCEMITIYVAIARDPAQPAMLRMQAARHLLDRLDNPFLDLHF